MLSVFTALCTTNVATGLALYFAPEIQSVLTDDNSGQIAAYEQRIVDLRLDVDRLHSRQYAQMGDLNLQMHDLVEQQEALSEQHQYVRMLAELAQDIGLGIHGNETAAIAAEIPAATASAGVSDLVERLYAMQEETRTALISLADVTTLTARTILDGLGEVGLADQAAEVGLGGPFIPADGLSDTSIIDEANMAAEALGLYRSAIAALEKAPVQRPVASAVSVSSNFGNRRDPFVGRTAFHAGVDFRAPSGTAILAAGSGTVVSAGTMGGYGKMVDIDHGNGLVTRYAHLNRIEVSEGQTVAGGQRIGASGSTGRSTGPHLHFEVRHGGSPVNPTRFLEAGNRLERFIKTL